MYLSEATIETGKKSQKSPPCLLKNLDQIFQIEDATTEKPN